MNAAQAGRFINIFHKSSFAPPNFVYLAEASPSESSAVDRSFNYTMNTDTPTSDYSPRAELSATQAMFAAMYAELRVIADRILGPGQSIQTLNPTVLVHEAYIKLAQGRGYDWDGRPHFLGIAARAIRSILVDYARRRNTLKLGGDRLHVQVTEECCAAPGTTEDLLALDEVLTLLAKTPPNGERLAHVVELRYFGGVSMEHTAQLLGVCESTVKDDWKIARAWIRSHLAGDAGHEPAKQSKDG